MANVCKVVACYFGNRRDIPRDKLNFLYDCFFKFEETIDPRVDYDLILVCPEVTVADELSESLFNRFFSVINFGSFKGNPSLKNVMVLTKRNIGASFGSFHHAFEIFKNRYEYWFFTEDDQIYIEEGYLKSFMNYLAGNDRIGYVTDIGISIGVEGSEHVNGAVGMSTSGKLLELYNVYSSLPHSEAVIDDRFPEKFYRKIAYQGEVLFTNTLLRLGYKLEVIPPRMSKDFIKNLKFFEDILGNDRHL